MGLLARARVMIGLCLKDVAMYVRLLFMATLPRLCISQPVTAHQQEIEYKTSFPLSLVGCAVSLFSRSWGLGSSWDPEVRSVWGLGSSWDPEVRLVWGLGSSWDPEVMSAWGVSCCLTSVQMWQDAQLRPVCLEPSRSEERRVGKECRSRWPP